MPVMRCKKILRQVDGEWQTGSGVSDLLFCGPSSVFLRVIIVIVFIIVSSLHKLILGANIQIPQFTGSSVLRSFWLHMKKKILFFLYKKNLYLVTLYFKVQFSPETNHSLQLLPQLILICCLLIVNKVDVTLFGLCCCVSLLSFIPLTSFPLDYLS